MKHALTPQQSLTISAFHTDIEDLIDFTVLSYDPFEGINQNVAEARIRGIESVVGLHRHALAGPRGSDLPGAAGPAPTTRGCCAVRRKASPSA